MYFDSHDPEDRLRKTERNIYLSVWPRDSKNRETRKTTAIRLQSAGFVADHFAQERPRER